MPKQNYRQAKRNREETRKKRQLEKQQKKSARAAEPQATAEGDASPNPQDPT